MVTIKTNEVAPGVYLITEKIQGFISKFSVNCVAVAGKNGFIFDSGSKKAVKLLSAEIKKITALNKEEIRDIIPSHGHWDHYSGLSYLNRNMGLNVLLTDKMNENISQDRTYQPREVEMLYGKTFKAFIAKSVRKFINFIFYKLSSVESVNCQVEIIDLNKKFTVSGSVWEIIKTPGHCTDHISLFNKDTGILLGGDNVLRSITTWLGPPDSNIETYLETLEKIKKLPNLKMIIPAHGSPVTKPVQRIDEIIEHRKKRTEEVLSIIKNSGDNGISLKTIIKKIYPETPLFKKYLAEGWIIITIDFLIKHNAIRVKHFNKNMHFIID